MNIERLFNEEIREKKRVGSNIFSRVSTRKGGGNQALRTASYFMKGSNKYKKLSGEVETYNLNTLLSLQEFETKNKSQQRMFMEAWRGKYKAKEIQKGMGISKNIYYKLVEELGLQTDSLGRGKRRDAQKLIELSEEELQKYMDNFIDFSLFKTLPRPQQITLLEKYLEDFPVQSELAKVWGADLKYVYYISSSARKQKAKEEVKKQKELKTKIVEDDIEMDTIISHENFKLLSDERQKEVLIHWRSKYISAEITKGMGISDGTLHGIISRLDVPRMYGKRKGVANTPVQNEEIESNEVENNEDVLNENVEIDSPIGEEQDVIVETADEKVEDIVEEVEEVEEVVEEEVEEVEEVIELQDTVELQDTTELQEDVVADNNENDQEEVTEKVNETEDNRVKETPQNSENDNSLTVEIKGNYSTNAILKSIQSILVTLEGEEEVMNIDLKVRKR
ncbi:hypothetical protein [Bacillus thuringiensis]|uniref:hypothetical protein n=1 Tax=Bacillus thuringiensis TaxID=1428 RepID=UPI000BFBAC0C|nr:hypothetical protein [Bacillus thuringiensis]PGT90113.1 hypothetical protein COD17_10205 [Bacillus thuringiensis]